MTHTSAHTQRQLNSQTARRICWPANGSKIIGLGPIWWQPCCAAQLQRFGLLPSWQLVAEAARFFHRKIRRTEGSGSWELGVGSWQLRPFLRGRRLLPPTSVTLGGASSRQPGQTANCQLPTPPGSDGSPRLRRAKPHRAAGGSATPKILAFCPSELPVKISISRRDRRPLQKLLRFGLQFGSPRCVE